MILVKPILINVHIKMKTKDPDETLVML
jgi:hypothetical protein